VTTSWITAASVQTLALRKHLRMHRLSHAAHYLAIIGLVVVVCAVIGVVMLAVLHRRGKPGPEG
jgi:hypothetical protein